MKKLLIIGDSFADCAGWGVHWPEVGISWTEMLNQNPEYQVTNLAQGGSSFYFSYKNFIGNYKNFDQIICCVTNPGRISVDIPGLTHPSQSHMRHHTGLMSVDYIRKRISKNDVIANEYLDAIEDYFLYIQDHDYDTYAQWTFVEYMKKLCNNIIIIPCFFDSVPNFIGDPMCDIGHNEIAKIFNTEFRNDIFKELHDKGYTDLRKHHMCEENNLIFYHDVLRWLSGEPVCIDSKKYVDPPRESNHYWRVL
jgi:hypothetical protein